MTNLLDKSFFLRINGEIESLSQKYLNLLDKKESNPTDTHIIIQNYLKEIKKVVSVSKPKTCDQFTQISLIIPGASPDDDSEDEDPEQFINFNFILKPLAERQLVNSWNIKDPLQYKLDL